MNETMGVSIAGGAAVPGGLPGRTVLQFLPVRAARLRHELGAVDAAQLDHVRHALVGDVGVLIDATPPPPPPDLRPIPPSFRS